MDEDGPKRAGSYVMFCFPCLSIRLASLLIKTEFRGRQVSKPLELQLINFVHDTHRKQQTLTGMRCAKY